MKKSPSTFYVWLVLFALGLLFAYWDLVRDLGSRGYLK